MVQIDWDRIRSVKDAGLTDDEIEDLFPMIVKCEIEEVDDIYDLRDLMKLSQEMLLYRDNQVESLLLECNDLKENLASAATASKSTKKQIETDAIEEDDNDKKIPDSSLTEHYEETIRVKNDKIKTLLLELEGIEKENSEMKQKLENLKEEMEDATDSMNEMTDELNDLRGETIIFKEEINQLKQEKTALLTQIEEITVQQMDRDKIIDEFGAAIDVRVSEWKEILDNKDAEIMNLKEQLSHTVIHSTPLMREQQISQIIHLNEEIEKRDGIIAELEEKLLEAVKEINESAGVIEKLKVSNKKLEKSGKRKEQRDALRKGQEANERISMLQESLKQAEDNLTEKSEQVCELLDILRRYEDKDHGLTEAFDEIKELKKQLVAKNEHIQELVSVVNKLENLSSHQEMQIAALRQKLGLPEDEEVSIEGVTLRHQEEAKIKNQLIQKNNALEQENIDLKADIRTLRYKLNKLGEKFIMSRNATDSRKRTHRSDSATNLNWVADQEITTQKHKSEMDEMQENVRIVIEENEALRKGMHEILDSIRDQDGRSTVDVQSDTLERLLEALDVRHLAGWYHPAMRLQERLNVIQGSNAELRTQVKQLRKEMHKKDELLRRMALKRDSKTEKPLSDFSESENEDVKTMMFEMRKIQSAYRDELQQWEEERETLQKENDSLKEIAEKLKAQLDIMETDLQAIESGEEETKKALVARTKECVQSAVNLIIITRKCSAAENLLNEEAMKTYQIQKESIAAESTHRKIVADLEKKSKLLENKIRTLESNLSNSVSIIEYNELKEKYEETNIRLRTSYELHLGLDDDSKESPDRSDSAINPLGGKPSEETVKNLIAINSELRDQLIELQNSLSQNLQASPAKSDNENKITELNEEIEVLKIENENLLKALAISREEAQMHYTVNSLKTLELDNLRHQILDLQAISEDKETIARLGFELNNCKATEIEMDKRKTQLETEIVKFRENLEVAINKRDEARAQLDEVRRHCANRCKVYAEIISILQAQYVGSTSMSSLQRHEDILRKLDKTREEISSKLKEAKEINDNARLQQETLTDRLTIVDHLKDILEQQIGNSDLQNMMHRFSEHSQSTLNEYRQKRKIAQLESELKMTVSKLIDYESTITAMEYDLINMQKVWRTKSENPSSPNVSPVHIQVPIPLEKKSVLIEARVESNSVATQSDSPAESPRLPQVPQILESIKIVEVPKIEDVSSRSDDVDAIEKIAFLQDQLKQALTLASERSAKLIKYESQITEYQAKLGILDKALADKDTEIVAKDKLISQKSTDSSVETEGTDKVALKSTINSLQQMIAQKEETISRYQTLLKEDRDEHNKAAVQFQEEIKSLKLEISGLKDEAEKRQEQIREVPDRDSFRSKMLEESRKESKPDYEAQEKIARLEEQVSTLEADLHISRELSERWRKLAEERLQHMDDIREKLEAQHKNELESYRDELDKWQNETSALRQQLSENRMKLAKGNISLSKELQERDAKIEELTVAYQQLQNEFEIMESITQSRPMSVHSTATNKVHDGGREGSAHLQTELDLLRRQHRSIAEKEKLYKDQIADLKQQLSRRYMAEKTEERRASQRELQLEKKLKCMEEELNKARLQLDHEYRVQEAKRVKTAEELSLWEKQKKWQQTAERLKKELKEKSDDYKRLNTSYDKLRTVVTCMEREKWYLRSKIRAENGNISGALSARSNFDLKIVEDLQVECQTLRDRINELTNRLESEDTHELIHQIEKQKRRIAALEIVAEGNSHVVDQIEKLEAAKTVLEKANIRLESENFELRMDIEKLHADTPRLREKVEHLEKYVELLKVEKSSDSSDRSSEKEQEPASKKSIIELEKTIFVLKRIVEKLQAENKRLRLNSKNLHRSIKFSSSSVSKVESSDGDTTLKRQYEIAKKRVIALETDLQLAEQRISMLEKARNEEENSGEISVLKHQLAHKSELLDKVKQLLTRAALNEKALRQKIHQIELKQTLATIPECHSSPSRNT